ncbi:hypothetical protein PBSP11RLL_000087200, partial [Plasmodium berghei]
SFNTGPFESPLIYDWIQLIGVAWGHLYSDVRGEILRFSGDKQLRKHLPKILPLIKNES